MQWRRRGEERRCGSMFWVVAWCAWGRKLKGRSLCPLFPPLSHQGLSPWNCVLSPPPGRSRNEKVQLPKYSTHTHTHTHTHTMDLTFSSQVKGHTWPVKCHTVMCTARRSYQLCRIWSLLNQTVFTRKDGWCRRRFPCIGWMCDFGGPVKVLHSFGTP